MHQGLGFISRDNKRFDHDTQLDVGILVLREGNTVGLNPGWFKFAGEVLLSFTCDSHGNVVPR